MSHPDDHAVLDAPVQDASPQMSPFDGCPRRTLLKAAGIAALVGAGGVAFAGCSSADTGTPASSAAPSTSGSASSAGASIAKADVPSGGGVVLPSADYVVTQPTPGDFKAFTSTCTHMQFKVGEVSGGQIKCLHHGSAFSIKDGSVINGPAQAPLAAAKATVSGSQIVVSG